jgi:ABC-2 type transport system permease protein
MAPVMASLASEQFKAVAAARWAAQMHAVKTLRGKLELISRIAIFAFYGVFGLLFGVGAGAIAYIAVQHRQTEFISGMIWFLFGFWQLFPILRAGFTNTFDANILLRFPVRYSTYYLLRCFYSALEPVALVSVLALTGITIGVSIADAALLPWCALVALLIVLLNILTTQLVLSWVERWLAQRRTREILGILFFLLMVGLQLIGPMAKRLERAADKAQPHNRIARQTIDKVIAVERSLPPGLAGYTLAEAQKRDHGQAAIGIAGLLGFGIGLGLLLDLRLRKQYRGENLSETAARRVGAIDKQVRVGWELPWVPVAVGAMVEKELRYLMRSGPMLLTFVMPVVVLVIFGGANSRQLPGQFASMTFPLAAAYSLLILTNVVYNTFGGDHAGVQFYFMSPVRLRNVIAAKNLVHMGIFLVELMILWVAVRVLRTPPPLGITFATLAAVPFALSIEFSAGNLLSIFYPKKLEFQMMGRQRTAQISGLLSIVVHAVVIGIAGLVFLVSRRYGVQLAVPVFLVLDAGALALYWFLLTKSEELLLGRRESVFEVLCRE